MSNYNVKDLTLEEAQKIIDDAPLGSVSIAIINKDFWYQPGDEVYITECDRIWNSPLDMAAKYWTIEYHIADVKKHIESLTSKPAIGKGNPKYDVTIHGKYDTGSCVVDVYRVLDAFNVTIPQQQHSIKKELKCGNRGHKDLEQDLIDIRDSAQSALDAFYDKATNNEH